MKHTTASLFLVAAMVIGMVGGATSATTAASDNSNITVQVGFKTAIDLSPSSLDFGTVEPGASKPNATIAGGETVTHLEVENVGSSNITHIWFNATTPSARPFGTGNVEAYDTGNFIQVSPTGEIQGVSTDDDFTFVNRKEFNESNDLSYIFTPDTGNWRYGRFRAGSQEYFWAVNATPSGTAGCYEGSNLRVGLNAHNQSKTGSNNFRDSSGEYTTYPVTDISGNANQDLAEDVWINSTAEGFTRQYDVVLNCDATTGNGGTGTWAMRSHYNVDPGAAADLYGTPFNEYVINDTNTSANSLKPGQHFSVNVSMEIPLGVAQGRLNQGTLRVFGNLQ